MVCLAISPSAASTHASAASAASIAAQEEADRMLVYELMQLEADAALNQARTGVLRAGRHDGMETSPSAGRPKLLALYGSGDRLLAHVSVNGQPMVYVRGRARPLGPVQQEPAYLLREMSASCVRLEGEQDSHTLCVYPDLQVRP